jgi:transcriptional regulator with XRE-family HTH domain
MDTPTKKPSYKNLAAFMAATGYTQEDVGRLCHLDQSSISRILSGQRGLSLTKALELARLTGVKIESFTKRGTHV